MPPSNNFTTSHSNIHNQSKSASSSSLSKSDTFPASSSSTSVSSASASASSTPVMEKDSSALAAKAIANTWWAIGHAIFLIGTVLFYIFPSVRSFYRLALLALTASYSTDVYRAVIGSSSSSSGSASTSAGGKANFSVCSSFGFAWLGAVIFKLISNNECTLDSLWMP